MGEWITVLSVVAIIAFTIAILASIILRAITYHRDKEALTAADLRMLQESVEALIVQLKTASDEAIAEMDRRQRELQALLDRFEEKMPVNQNKPVELEEISALVEEGLEQAEIARRAGLSRSEVELLLEMQATRN